jgi:CHAT domain-containing protein
MRRLLVLAALLAINCRTGGSLLQRAADAEALLRQERFNEELPLAQAGLREAEGNAGGDPQTLWRFRLLVAEGLIGKREMPESLKVLAGYGMPPAGSSWDDVRAHLLFLKGQASYILNRFPEAGDLLAQAGAYARSPALAAEIEVRNGALLTMRNQFADARAACEHALSVAAQLHDRNLEARAAGNYGYSLMTESRYDEAIPWFERAERTALAIGAGDTAARNRGNIGACYARLGDYDSARPCYDTARNHFDTVHNLYELQAWTGNEANLFYENGDLAEASVRYQHALSLARQIDNPSWMSRWLLNLAAVSIDQENWESADRYNKEGLELNRKAQDTLYEPLSVIDSAKIAMGRGRLDEAAQLFHDALNGRSEGPTIELDAHTGLAGLFLRNGEPRQADAEFRAAIAAIDRRQSQLLKDEYKLSWLSSLIRFYRQYADFLVAQGKPDEALQVAESSRSKVLSTNVRLRTPAELRQLSRSTGATLLEYFFGVTASYLWVVTPEGIHCHTLPAKSSIRRLAEHYAAVIAAGRNPLEVDADSGVKLYDTLIAPARADAPNSERFILVPDEDLYSLNFETLPNGDDTAHYWIAHATVSTAPSLSYLQTRRRATPKLLLLGDAAPSGAFPKLEFAGSEIDAIQAALPNVPAIVRKQNAATPQAWREARPESFSLIHFAAHASANSANPLDSAVILTGGRLLARDVVATPLNAELVTVSACRSAGGRTYAGEGIVGFAWAFLKAGSGNVIAGLWDVNDKSTTQLMTTLYTEIGKGADVPDALREAKLQLIRQGGAYAKPFYWAPFQVYTARP